MTPSVRIPLPAKTPQHPLAAKAPFSIEQRPSMLLLAAHEPWERLRLMRLDGTLVRECRNIRQVNWALDKLSPGIYWVVAEWIGQRSSRAVVID